MTTEDQTKIIRSALTAAGLEPDNYQYGVYAIADNDAEESEETLAEINAALPDGYRAEWTGNSDTNADGDTTSDAAFFFGDERIEG